MMEILPVALISFGVMFLLVPILLFLVRSIGLYTIVHECTCQVYVLFGKVVGTIDEPGLHVLPFKLGPAAFLVNWIGQRHVLDMRLDQEYLRSQPVNSEEGAPMGIGMWYEMYISDPVAFLFKNTDPRGSLRANVSNATVRCLSNMRLADMLETRHTMSQVVRAEAEVEPLTILAAQLAELKASGPGSLQAYLRNLRVSLLGKASRTAPTSWSGA